MQPRSFTTPAGRLGTSVLTLLLALGCEEAQIKTAETGGTEEPGAVGGATAGGTAGSSGIPTAGVPAGFAGAVGGVPGLGGQGLGVGGQGVAGEGGWPLQGGSDAGGAPPTSGGIPNAGGSSMGGQPELLGGTAGISSGGTTAGSGTMGGSELGGQSGTTGGGPEAGGNGNAGQSAGGIPTDWCQNGVQDSDELGVDCGGSCPSCCENGALDAGETDVDCGGDCVSCCQDGRVDNGELGMDCGGECEPCPVVYRLPPPDPCFDQQTNQECFSGTDTSCKERLGADVCQVVNVCEGKTPVPNQPVTFMCPRAMLFSLEMEQAVKDDAIKYGWDSDDPPFNYAVAGHDAGPLDSGLSNGCCQCYQLVLGKPLNNAPQPPLMPIPKPLIVQAFNTAAGGGNNFDIYMAVGGYGAFNGCYNEPTCGQTATAAGQWAYTSYVDYTQVSGTDACFRDGGLRYLNVSECVPTIEPPDYTYTMDKVVSEACQNKISELCSQIEAPSPVVTQSSIDSCIKGNLPESLYHQNWEEVRAKRVECPEALTRVTGCRLQDQGLPQPDPAIQQDSQADSSFGTGYSITTMQDCCMPTCSWYENVHPSGGTNPATYEDEEGSWRSFYSCDANGDPYTIESAR